ncbi:hypothetical protein [Roseibium sp. SCP14]|uniref:hypothetical protein n=1 Tax=Roseibium sp. SCP14 TaxID=3141375 RepID=UPI003336C66E
MLNPREAAEDSHALNLAILFIASVAVLISIYFHHDTALKYWLLNGFGKTVPGTILSVESSRESFSDIQKITRQNRRNSLKNLDALISGSTVLVEFKPEKSQLQILSFKMPVGFTGRQDTNTLDITYLPVNPRIAYPADHLINFALDSKIMFWSLVAGLIIIWLGLVSIQKWIGFRRRMRRY